MNRAIPAICFGGITALLSPAVYPQGPDLMLAKAYHQDVDLTVYLVSEKFDGMRAYWTGSKLVTRGGSDINAPSWFIEDLPDYPLDGELWLGYGRFQELMSVVRDAHSRDQRWHQVRFLVYDLPMSLDPFYVRNRELQQLLQRIDQPHLRGVRQHSLADRKALQAMLEEVQQRGGEGLMLKRYDSPYLVGRSSLMLKLKVYQDAEAVVLEHLPGKGKYHGQMGALLVRDASGRQFALGSGFSDEQRQNPPPVGSTVTYRFNGYTDSGLPRFARFERLFTPL
ncbi:DNA ligase [Ferrimonas senticii]|uniref:DNA ligase n=1 Tax=Ferrimonas senticii TaxID=394566 RepID=UPI0003FF672C|nr:DNA ligase [Ferrimonas senticii]